MFESAELGHRIEKAQYHAEVPELRQGLLDAQYDLATGRKFPVIILIAGVDGAGKSAVVQTLNEWMDPRQIQTHGFYEPTEEEQERPYMWRYWRDLPRKGKMAIFDGSWYNWSIYQRAYGHISLDRLDRDLARIQRFEQMLIDEGALVLKFWMHLSKVEQRKRFKKLEGDAATRWRVTETDWEHHKRYDDFRDVIEKALRRTSTAEAPWMVVESTDARYQNLTVGRCVLEQLKARLEKGEEAPKVQAPPLRTSIDGVNILQRMDLSLSLGKKEYEEELEHYQGRLAMLTRREEFKKRNVVLVFEGMDAAGKGGSIRRIVQAVDLRLMSIIPIGAPTEEERAQPYLWRFWRHLPRKGRMTVFDRSWYGRVLVERVEGFCREADWMRAYGEINDFESQIVRSDTVLLKFWLSISQDEQLRRFEERQAIGFKRFKITDEDWRNRDKWDLYEKAVCDMLERTSTEIAPWTLVESEDKRYARIKILKEMCKRLEAALEEA